MLKELDEEYKLLERSHGAEETNEILHYLHSVLNQYESVLPKDVTNNIDAVFKATDVGPSQLKGMLLNVKDGVQAYVNTMPVPAVVSTALIIKGVIIAAAVSAGVYGGSIVAFPVDIQIFNHGCPPIAASQNMPIPIGVKLPSSPILSGEMGIVTVPRVTATIGANNNGVLSIGVWGSNFPIQLISSVSDIQFDHMSVIGHPRLINLGEKQQHQLDVFCK